MKLNHDRFLTRIARGPFHGLCTATIVLGLLVAQVAAHPVRRITFKRGATVATVTGRLRGQNDVVRFVLRVRAGQHMHISVESTELTNPMINVVFPSGDGMDRDMQGSRFDTDSTEAGDYHIDVYEGRKGDPSNGTFVLKIEAN
jgi:hypothetical protein